MPWLRATNTSTTGYTAKQGELVFFNLATAAANSVVNVPAAPVLNTYFGVKVKGATGGFRIDIKDGGSTIATLQLAEEMMWVAYDGTSWRVVDQYVPVSSTLPEYRWYWADAAARNAQSVTSAEVGGVGYQVDMELEFVLVGTSPTVWGQRDDPSYFTIGAVLCTSAGNANNIGTNILQLQTGAFAARTLASTNAATARVRSALNTGAVAGNTAYVRGTGGQQTIGFANGMRYRIVAGPGAVSADMRWVYGLYDILAANVNQAPTVVLNALAMGADGGNLCIYHNDGSGAATAIDLGASFPGVTAGNIYDTSFFAKSPTDVRYMVRNLASGAEVSGPITTNLPLSTHFFNHGLWSCNNATAAAVSADIASIVLQQRYR